MSKELSTVVSTTLFKSTTDGLSGERVLKSSGGTLSWATDPTIAYASLYAGVSTDFTLTAATPLTLSSATMWSTSANKNVTVDLTAGELTASVAGVYQLASWLSLEADTISTLISIRYSINGVPSPTALKGLAKDVGDTNNLSASLIISLGANDTVSLEIETDKDAVVTVTDAGLTLHKIDEV